MGFLIGIIKRILKLILAFAILVSIIILIPNLPPYTKFTSIEIEPTQPLVGPLAPNNVLNSPDRLYEDKLLAPEAFQIWNGEVYTGLATGEVVKVSPGGHVTFVTKIGQPCSGLVEEHICGRPLGLVIDEVNKLIYIADAYHGLWKVNLLTDKKQLLVSPRVPIEGRIPKLFNSVALDKNGNLFWTDSSSDFSLQDGILIVLADPSGRLLQYNAAKNESKVLLDNLWFPNGLAISPDNQFVVVAESSKFRLVKYYIDGPKKGAFEVFAAGLPGIPDNVRPLPDGSGILVALYNAFIDDHPILMKSTATAPLARKFLARFHRLIEIAFEFLNSQVPHYIFQEIIYYIGSIGSFSKIFTGTSGLVQLDWNGNIVAAYYNTDGKLHSISDAIVFNDKLYMGAPHKQNFIGSVPAPSLLKKAFSKKQSPVKEQPKANEPNQNKAKTEEKTVDKPVENKEQPKQIPQEAKRQAHVEKQPHQIKSQAPVKQNAVPKDTLKVDSKEAEIKTNQIPKTDDLKPKNVEKEAQKLKEPIAKAKYIPKESDAKPKMQPKLEKKPKEEQKRPETKRKEEPKKPEIKPNVQEKPKEEPKKSEATLKAQEKVKEQQKIKEIPKQAEVKPKVQEIPKEKPKPNAKPTDKKINEEPKPASKETEPKTKTKEVDVKPKISKEHVKPQNTNNDKKNKDDSINFEKAENPIPVEEIIPSDTAKPNKEKLKVIKKNGPQEIPNPHI